MSRMKKELFYYFLGETVADETVADPPNILLLFGWKCWWSKLLRYMFPCPLFAMMEVYLMTIALQMTACSTLLICWIIIEGEASSKITRKCGQSSWNPWHKIERKNLLQYIFEYSLLCKNMHPQNCSHQSMLWAEVVAIKGPIKRPSYQLDQIR